LFAGRREAEDALSGLETMPFEESSLLLLAPAERE
jgi:hypothetical protein